MDKQSIDTVLRVKLRHRPGQLAAVASAIAVEKALLGEIVTIRSAEEHTVRELTVETSSDEQTARVIDAVRRIDGVDRPLISRRG